jgi:ribonuclease J
VPLGGLGEVGINMWALEWEKQILVVDAGLMFPHEDMLGIDLVLPDISYLLDRSKDVLGIFLSHGHEDHIGGLPYVLKKLNVPVYGTRLTLGLVKPKLKEHRILREADLREVRVGDAVQLGPFKVVTSQCGFRKANSPTNDSISRRSRVTNEPWRSGPTMSSEKKEGSVGPAS